MKRTEETEENLQHRTSDTGTLVESIRSIHDTMSRTKSGGEPTKLPFIWQVFGGTILSIFALIAVTMFNTMNNSIAELRSDVARLNEAKAEAAKKDDMNTLRTQVSLMTGFRSEIDSLKERASKYRAELEEAKKENQSKLDLMKKDLVALETLKEKSTTLAAELKLAKDDLQKVRQDVDKNQSADNERRDLRTAQMKAVDETIKEIQKILLESREKIARLEGQQVPTKPAAAVKATEATGPAR